MLRRFSAWKRVTGVSRGTGYWMRSARSASTIRRAPFFRGEFEAFLLLAREEGKIRAN